MIVEKQKEKEPIPENITTKIQSKIRWSWVILGVMLLLFGLLLPSLATNYYSKIGNQVVKPDPIKIPRSPDEQSKVKENLLKKSNSNLSVSIQTKNLKKLDKRNYQKSIYNYLENPTPNLLAFQLAENKTVDSSKTAKPSPTAAPKPDETSDGEKNRNVLEKIYDWIVGLFKKKNRPADVTSLKLSEKTIFLSCPPGTKSNNNSCSDNMSVQVTTTATDPENEVLQYDYVVSGGRIVGQGKNVTWDLSGVRAGIYTITASVDDGRERSGKTKTKRASGQTKTETVSVMECSCQNECSCPMVSVTGPSGETKAGEVMTFTANVSGGNQDGIIYNWSVDQGTIINGQGTPVVSVAIDDLSGESGVTAEVSISSENCNCFASASETGMIARTAAPVGLYSYSGQVKDTSGNVIPGARVTLKNLETGEVDEAIADSEGKYRFNFLSSGNYEISVFVRGFIGQSATITVQPNQTNSIVFTLETSGNNSNTNSESNTNTGGNTNNNVNANINGNINANIDTNVNSNANTSVNSNTSDNSNMTVQTKEGSDQITYDYPKYLLEDTDHYVHLELKYVKGTPTPSRTETTVNTNTTVVIVEVPDNLPQDRKNYDTYVNAEFLSGEGLESTNECGNNWQKYKREFKSVDYPKWCWKVRLSDNIKDQKEVEFNLKLSFGFKPENSPNSEITDRKSAWITKPPLKAYIGLPLWVWLLYYLSLPGGAVLSALGVIKGKNIEEIPEVLVIEDDVQCTLYTPTEAKAGNDFIVQVFAHLEEQAESLVGIAAMTDENLKKQAVKDLDQPIKRGSVLTFQLSMSGVEIDDPIQNYKWNGKVVDVPFIISVPKDHEPIVKFGKVVVSENNVPIGRLTFKVSIMSNIQTLKVEDKSLSKETFERYQYAFISYASENRAEVLERVQMLAAAKIEYFQDVLNFDPGERWEKALYKHIDESDVVFLFWSKAASESKWVEKEILYALARQQGKDTAPPDIIPIIIEGPPPVRPPASLNFLHFNDKFMYFIYAAEAEHELKKTRK